MSAWVMVPVGLMLAMAGIWSVRLVLVCAGAGVQRRGIRSCAEATS